MPVPDLILQLVQRFDDNRSTYRSAEYNEAQLRLEFLDPLFEALGWDISNKQGYELYGLTEEEIMIVEGSL